MKTAQRVGASLLTLAIFASSVAPVFANNLSGFDSYQLTYNNQNNHSMASGGQYVAWLVDTFEGNVEVAYTDILRGRYGQVTFDNNGSKKDINIDPNGMIVWAGGNGTSTDIYGYDAAHGSSFRFTSDGANNQKPRIAGQRITWSKTVSGVTQVMVADIYGGLDSGTQITSGASASNSPRITQESGGNYLVYWEDVSSSGIKYWEDVTKTIHTARTPAFLCSADHIGEAAVRDTKLAYTETCTAGTFAQYFDAGANIGSTGDDTNTKVSSGLLTSANTPTVSSSNGNSTIAWAEGSLLSTATVQVKGLVGSVLGLLGLGSSSLLNDKVAAAANVVAFQRHNADSTIDVLAHDHLTGNDYTVATGATLDGNPSISEVFPDQSDVWGGYFKASAGRNDLYLMLPRITTPTGTNVVVSPGNGTKITYPSVTSAGYTTFTTKSLFTTPSTPLTGFQLGSIPTYYDVHTTSTWTGTATVCLEYSPGNFNDNESLLQLLHNESGVWTDRTLSIDTANHVICAGVTSFSEIAFAVRPPTVISSIDQTNLVNTSSQKITISGSGFLTGPKLMLGSTELTDVQYVDANTLTATVPAGLAAGSYPLILINRYGSGATLNSAVNITAANIPAIRQLITDAGLSGSRDLYNLLDKAEKEINEKKNIEAVKTLKDFKKQLANHLSKKQGFNLNFVQKAFAASNETVDITKIKGVKKQEPVFKNASLKLPQPTVSSQSGKIAPKKVLTDTEKIQQALDLTDQLINQIQTTNMPLAVLPAALAVAALGGIILVQHHVRRRRRRAKEKK